HPTAGHADTALLRAEARRDVQRHRRRARRVDCVHDRGPRRLPARAEFPTQHGRRLRGHPAALGDRHRGVPARRRRGAARDTVAHAVDAAPPALPTRSRTRRSPMKFRLAALATLIAVALAVAAATGGSSTAAPKLTKIRMV